MQKAWPLMRSECDTQRKCHAWHHAPCDNEYNICRQSTARWIVSRQWCKWCCGLTVTSQAEHQHFGAVYSPDYTNRASLKYQVREYAIKECCSSLQECFENWREYTVCDREQESVLQAFPYTFACLTWFESAHGPSAVGICIRVTRCALCCAAPHLKSSACNSPPTSCS